MDELVCLSEGMWKAVNDSICNTGTVTSPIGIPVIDGYSHLLYM